MLPEQHPATTRQRAASVMLARVISRRVRVSEKADADYLADVALAANFDELLAAAEHAERAFRAAQAASAAGGVLYPLARTLDTALTDVMRAAYAAQRAEIGPRGYDDRIYRRKAMARPAVHAWTDEAERLLTMRETHQLTGIPPRPVQAAGGAAAARTTAA